MSNPNAYPADLSTVNYADVRAAAGVPNPLILSPYRAILLYERYKAGELDRPVTDESDCDLIRRLCAFFTFGDGRGYLAVAR